MDFLLPHERLKRSRILELVFVHERAPNRPLIHLHDLGIGMCRVLKRQFINHPDGAFAHLRARYLVARHAVLHQLPRHPHETIDGWTTRDHRLEKTWIRISDENARLTTNLFTSTGVNFAHAGALRLGTHRARNHLIGVETVKKATAAVLEP